MKYILEHLEKRLYKWCFIEYKHISEIVGKDNLIFTNIKSEKERIKLKPYGKICKESIAELNLKNMCILDPAAEKTLSPKDKFSYLVFGGILGDYPPKARTKKELSSKIKCEKRNLGKGQMPTDNAIYVAKQIAEGKTLEDLKFISNITIEINENEAVDLPFRYVLVNNKPLISEELAKHLKKRKYF